MSQPINPSTNRVEQSIMPLSFIPSSPSTFPISYADNIWDIAVSGSSLAELTEAIGQFDQHTINELFAYLILSLLPQPSTHQDFTDDFTDDFN